jgi:hypothetical protein
MIKHNALKNQQDTGLRVFEVGRPIPWYPRVLPVGLPIHIDCLASLRAKLMSVGGR